MTETVLAALGGATTRAPVLGYAKLLARLCDATPAAVHVAEARHADTVGAFAFHEQVGLQVVHGDPLAAVVGAAQKPSVAFVVVGAHRAPNGRGPGFVTREIATRLRQPLLVVPAGACVPMSFERVLFPLAGTAATTAPIGALLDRLAFGSNTDLIALHSFPLDAAAPFADHESHETEHRIRAFGEHLPAGFAGGVVTRTGSPEHVVPQVAEDLDASLTVVTWSQVFSPGRATVVTQLLAHPTRPTLLVPAYYGTAGRTVDVRAERTASLAALVLAAQ